jgi:hypothetical protein
MNQICKTGIVADGVKKGMHFKKLENAGLLLVSTVKPNERLIVVVESEVRIDKSAGGNIACLPALLNSSIRRSASVRFPA